jgi:hypothetical protein
LTFGFLDELREQWRYEPLRAETRHDLEFLENLRDGAFPWYTGRFPAESDHEWVLRSRRQKLWWQMVSLDQRGFFHCCRTAARDGRRSSAGEISSWLAPDGPMSQILTDDDRATLTPFFLAHLLCARTASTNEKSLRKVQSTINKSTRAMLPFGFLRDLAEELLSGRPRPAERVGSIVVVILRSRTKRT